MGIVLYDVDNSVLSCNEFFEISIKDVYCYSNTESATANVMEGCEV